MEPLFAHASSQSNAMARSLSKPSAPGAKPSVVAAGHAAWGHTYPHYMELAENRRIEVPVTELREERDSLPRKRSGLTPARLSRLSRSWLVKSIVGY
jgi:hypothetical protein